ncbi:MAG: NAD+ synthase [Elusimicrobia bacterium]|nr:NAD+ synthase [Candidatus Obscuribacterium magneticum]
MKIGIAQMNPTVGDLSGNRDILLTYLRDAERAGCDLVVFPEMALTGYPTEDLLLKPAFIDDNIKILKSLVPLIDKTAALIGFADHSKGKRYNAAAWIQGRKIKAITHKQFLPNYGVFDEERYFDPGRHFLVVPFQNRRVGITICEDIWKEKRFLVPLKKRKPDFVVNISASPFHAGKLHVREKIVKEAARFLHTPLVYVNLVGGQDELVFDGGSFVALPNGQIKIRFPQFKSGLFCFDLTFQKGRPVVSTQTKQEPPRTLTKEIHEALLSGLRDYVSKNGFQKVAVAVSGGIDSALVAALAQEALGADCVVGITMPSPYNLPETRGDARQLAKNLNVRLIDIPIKPILDSFMSALNPHFEGTAAGIAEENLQARIRGTLMMALSNKFGWLVLTTGNKSETSTGYCTLYGDTAGGFAVIKDVLKTTVYDLARAINKKAGRDLIPQGILTRPPTAELKEDQRDEDTLGPYAQLDPVVVRYVEENASLQELSKEFPGRADYLWKIIGLIDKSEYKRRQAPPGIKITPRSFGRDHRMPITNRYRPS